MGKEFMCPLPNPNEKKAHIIIDPVILSCCGTTCCLECKQSTLFYQINNIYFCKGINRIFKNKNCAFCGTQFATKGVKIFPNLPLQRLLD